MTFLHIEQLHNMRQTARTSFRERRTYLEMFLHSLEIFYISLKKREISPKNVKSIFNRRPGSHQLNICRSPCKLMNFRKNAYIPAEFFLSAYIRCEKMLYFRNPNLQYYLVRKHTSAHNIKNSDISSTTIY